METKRLKKLIAFSLLIIISFNYLLMEKYNTNNIDFYYYFFLLLFIIGVLMFGINLFADKDENED